MKLLDILEFIILYIFYIQLLAPIKLKVGTKSVLYGAHCFFIHPFYVAKAWKMLYGKRNLKLWVSFFVHDIGYWNKPNMDGAEGELHPYLGAKIMHKLFDKNGSLEWYRFTLYHSRFLAKKEGGQYSKLCVADKYAIVLTPSWLYIPMVKASGEIWEYIKDAERNSNGSFTASNDKLYEWHHSVKDYVAKWVEDYKEIKVDVTTPTKRTSIDKNGIWH